MDPLSFDRRVNRYMKMLPAAAERIPAVYYGPEIVTGGADIPPAPGADPQPVPEVPDEMTDPVFNETTGWVEADTLPDRDLTVRLHPAAVRPEVDV